MRNFHSILVCTKKGKFQILLKQRCFPGQRSSVQIIKLSTEMHISSNMDTNVNFFIFSNYLFRFEMKTILIHSKSIQRRFKFFFINQLLFGISIFKDQFELKSPLASFLDNLCTHL